MRDAAVMIVLFAMAIACALLIRPAPAPAGVQAIEEMTPDRVVLVVVQRGVTVRETWVRTPSGWRALRID